MYHFKTAFSVVVTYRLLPLSKKESDNKNNSREHRPDKHPSQKQTTSNNFVSLQFQRETFSKRRKTTE